jgi:hypothetical protein
MQKAFLNLTIRNLELFVAEKRVRRETLHDWAEIILVRDSSLPFINATSDKLDQGRDAELAFDYRTPPLM